MPDDVTYAEHVTQLYHHASPGSLGIARRGFDIAARGVIEGYVLADRLKELVDRYVLAPSPQPNAILHVVSEPWPFPVDSRLAPAIAAAADLGDSDEQQTRDPGFAYLDRLQAIRSEARQ